MEGEGPHKAPPQAEELLIVDGFWWGRELFFFKVVATDGFSHAEGNGPIPMNIWERQIIVEKVKVNLGGVWERNGK